MPDANDPPMSTRRSSAELDQQSPEDSVSHMANGGGGETNEQASEPRKPKRGWRFWTIFVSLCVTILLAAVESTVTSTALPTISNDLDAGNKYVWFVNSFFLTR